MARKITWSHLAKEERKKILAYWKSRNKSDTYSRKLFHLFQETVQQISIFPEMGRPTSFLEIRSIIVRDYLILYEVSEQEIIILTIWDSRQDPEKLNLILM